MKILYGVQGTGNGHLSRARVMAKALAEQNIQVDYLFSGRAANSYFSMEHFSNFQTRQGLSFCYHQGKIQRIKTLKNNAFIDTLRDIRQLDCRSYDLVISDFEPITAWAAKRSGTPSLSISHQSAFRYDVPKTPGFYGAKSVMRCFAPTDFHLGLHWHHFNQTILPPIIEPMQPMTSINNKILVYMGFENLADIMHFLRPFDRQQFHIYANVNTPQTLGNIFVKPLSYQGFHKDLLDCQGVISNAGFELASEAISLGKKLLVKPLLGQYEQLSNAQALKQLGRGHVMQSLDHHTLENWLHQPLINAIAYPNVAKAISLHISKGLWHDSKSLAEELWGQTSMPLCTSKHAKI